jgi:hypothetical protein
MYRNPWLVATAAWVAVCCFATAEECQRPDRSIQVGRDDAGYFIRAQWNEPRAPVPTYRPVENIGDFLAGESGASIVYLEYATTRPLGPGEWRDSTPLGVLRAYTEAGGLKLLTPSERLWLVVSPTSRNNGAFTVFARPLDAGQSPPTLPGGIGAAEQAFFMQLPVREARCAANRDCSIGLHYLWLAGEGEGTALVVASAWDWSGAPELKAFKVRLEESQNKLAVRCLWRLGLTTGFLVPSIAEDFDGDGYRDFVFRGHDKAIEFGPSIVSGRDGSQLLAFDGGTIAVEQASSGPKRVAAEVTLENSNGRSANHLFVFDRAKGAYVEQMSQEDRAREAAAVGSQRSLLTSAAEVLAKAVGGKDRVKVVRFTPYDPENYLIDREHGSMPENSRVLYRYESPAWIAENERLRKQLEKNPPAAPHVDVVPLRPTPMRTPR